MPTFIQEVPELDICVRRPIIDQVIKDLFRQTNIDSSKLKIYQTGRTVAIPQLNSTLDESVNKERLSTENRVEVMMDEEITNVTTAPILYANNIAIFRDPKLKVEIVPTMVSTKTSINLRFICNSRAAAMNWQQAIRRQVSQGMFNPIHTVNYYYPIPDEHMYVLSKIYEMREAQAGYGDTFGTWLRDHFNSRFSVITNHAGKGTQFIMREQQTNITGYYEFSEEVEKVDKEEGVGTYATEFTYTFFYERPENMVIHFPIIIHNQIVPAEIRDDRQVEDVHPEYYYLTNDAAAFHSFAYGGRKVTPYKNFTGWPLPFFDEWYPTYRQLHYENIFRVASQVSPDDLRWIGNVDAVKPYSFSEEVLKYIKKRPHAMSHRRDHLFNVSLHRWDELFASNELTIDKDLKVTTPDDLNLRDMWHMNIDICTDISILTDEALRDLCEEPDVLDKWVDVFDPDGPLSKLPKNPDGTYNPNDVKDAIIDSGNNIYHNRHRIARVRTVGFYGIVTMNRP